MVPKATVVLTNKQTGAVRETTTDDAGRFSLLSVVPGVYDMKVDRKSVV